MADVIGKLTVAIVGDNSKLDKSIKESKKSTEKFGESTEKLGKSLGKLFAGIGFAVVAKKLLDIGKASIKAASAAEETRNKFSVVFASVADEAKAAADRISTEFALSDETTEKFLSGVGDITTGLGATSEEALLASEKITSLGLDINSFANLSGGAEQAVSALTSLFTGEREAAKALGIVINDTNLKAYAEGMGKVYKELTPLEKGFLSLELATSQSQLAIGDFARSSDSFANTQKAAAENTKDLAAAIGSSLLPAATSSLGIYNKWADKITDIIKEHNDLRTLLDKFANDTDTAQDRVDLTEREIAATQKLYDANLALLKAQNDNVNNERDQLNLDRLYEKSSLLNTEIREKQRLLAILKEEAAAEKEIADALAEKERKAAEYAKIQLDAASLIEQRRVAALTDEEKQIDSLNKQIELWSKYREIAGVQQLLNDLVKERTALLEGNSEEAEEELTALQEAADERLRMSLMVADAIEDRDRRIRESSGETKDAVVEDIDKLAEAYEQVAQQALAAMSGMFSSIDTIADNAAAGELMRLEERNQEEIAAAEASGATEEELVALKKKLAEDEATVRRRINRENTIREKALGLTDAIINTAVGISKSLTLPFPANIIAAAITGAAGAVQIGAIASTPVPALAGGGVVPGGNYTGNDTVPAMLSPGEVVMNPLQQAETLMAIANGGGNGQTRVIVNLGKRVILDAVAQGTKDGTLIIDSRSVR